MLLFRNNERSELVATAQHKMSPSEPTSSTTSTHNASPTC